MKTNSNKNNTILLSLIIPIYNVEKYIEQCLISIYSQNIPEDLYEVIIVNDGTPDNAMSIVNKFSHHDNLKILNQENQGLSIARNNGMAVSQGEYIWFIDSDDWLLPNALSIAIDEIKSNPTIDVFSSRLLMYYENNQKEKIDFNPDIFNLSGKEYLIKRYNAGASQRFILKSSFLNENKLFFYPHILHEDGVFGYSMLYLATHIKIIETPLYAYRIRSEGSIMSSISVKSSYDLIKGHKILKKFMKEKVGIEDQIWYQIRIFSMLSSCFIFTEKIINTPEFLVFYQTNKSYIKQECKIMQKANWNILRYLFLRISPYYYFKVRNYIVSKNKKTNK